MGVVEVVELFVLIAPVSASIISQSSSVDFRSKVDARVRSFESPSRMVATRVEVRLLCLSVSSNTSSFVGTAALGEVMVVVEFS